MIFKIFSSIESVSNMVLSEWQLKIDLDTAPSHRSNLQISYVRL